MLAAIAGVCFLAYENSQLRREKGGAEAAIAALEKENADAKTKVAELTRQLPTKRPDDWRTQKTTGWGDLFPETSSNRQRSPAPNSSGQKR